MTQRVFNYVTVDYAVAGTTRVSWQLMPRFYEPPHSFQLQVELPDGAWQDVGVPVVDTLFATDSVSRICTGNERRTRYRVKLTTPAGVYYSQLATTLGELTFRQWSYMRGIIRRARTPVMHTTMSTFRGKLYRRTVTGTVCTECVDAYTGGVTDSHCPTCHGVGYIPGYWLAGDNLAIDIAPATIKITQNTSRGTVQQHTTRGRFIGLPLLFTNDIWTMDAGDQHYRIGKIRDVATINQVPAIVDAELFLLPADDIAYDVAQLA